MALDEIKIWAMDVSGDATPLSSAAQTDTERQLEHTLVQNPEMLAPGLSLVGQQTRTDEGWLDLLGVDEDGRLVVFELKRGTLSREAVAQVIDYASFLDAKSEPDLVNFISERGNLHDLDKAEGFEEWYGHKFGENESASLKPVRMVLVGLGVDERTSRMVQFLADGGIEISLLIFLGFRHGGQTLLARQVQATTEGKETTRSRGRLGRRKRRDLLDSHVREHTEHWSDAEELWNSVLAMFRETFQDLLEIPGAGASEWSKHQLRLRSSSVTGTVATMQLGPLRNHDWLVNVIFSRRSVESCIEEFRELRRELPFQVWPSNSPDQAEGVLEVGFPLKSLTEWEERKEKLAGTTRSVYEAILRSEND